MKIKFLSVIVSFLSLSIAITSCLDSNTNEIEYSSDATIHAFALDSAKLKKDYKFTINQIAGRIYNQDSLPVGSDSIIKRILIKTLTTASGIVTMKSKANQDSLLNLSDSIDLSTKKYTESNPLILKVWAPNMSTTKEYKIWVQVHKQDPDSLNWGNSQGGQPIAKRFSNGSITGKQKAVILNKEIFVYSKTSTGVPFAYKTSTSDGTRWQGVSSLPGLPITVKLSSIVSFRGALYAVADNQVYSSQNGTDWKLDPLLNRNDYKIQTLLVSCPPRKEGDTDNNQIPITVGIAAIFSRTADAVVDSYFAFTDENAASWIIGNKVPTNFPSYDISATTCTNPIGQQGAILMGSELPKAEIESAPTIPWASYDGISWTDLSTTNGYCPLLVQPSIIFYGNKYYAFGNDFKAFYTSLEGLAWNKTSAKFNFPGGLQYRTGSNYSMVVDEENFIWIMCSVSSNGFDDVWRARLNKLGFKNAITQ